MPRSFRILIILVFLALIAAALVNLVRPNSIGSRTIDMPLSRLYKEIDAGNVELVRFQDSNLRGMLRDGQRFEVRGFEMGHPGMENLVGELRTRDVEFSVDPRPLSSSVITLLSVIAFPLMILALIYFLVLRPAQVSAPAVRLPTSMWEVHRELLGLRQEVADLQIAVQHLEDELYSQPKS